jgi:hypothetical protein
VSRRAIRLADIKGLSGRGAGRERCGGARASAGSPLASAKTKAGITRSKLQAALLLTAVGARGGPQGGVLEHRFHSERRWRFDVAWPEQRIAVEIDGGGWTAGRHSRGAGMRTDCEKLAAALLGGWRVLRVMPEHVSSGQAAAWAAALLASPYHHHEGNS